MRLYKASEAAKILGIRIETLRRWANEGLIRPVQLPGRRSYMYSQKEIERFIEENTIEPAHIKSLNCYGRSW